MILFLVVAILAAFSLSSMKASALTIQGPLNEAVETFDFVSRVMEVISDVTDFIGGKRASVATRTAPRSAPSKTTTTRTSSSSPVSTSSATPSVTGRRTPNSLTKGWLTSTESARQSREGVGGEWTYDLTVGMPTLSFTSSDECCEVHFTLDKTPPGVMIEVNHTLCLAEIAMLDEPRLTKHLEHFAMTHANTSLDELVTAAMEM
jgi:hypothetical protein